MTIGELAKSASVNVETIRYYQRIGLLAEPAKPAQGFRIYQQDSLEQLSFILRSKVLGFSLNDIRELLTLRSQQGSCAEVCSLAQKNLATIRQRITELQKLEKQVSQLLSSCQATSNVCLVLSALES